MNKLYVFVILVLSIISQQIIRIRMWYLKMVVKYKVLYNRVWLFYRKKRMSKLMDKYKP